MFYWRAETDLAMEKVLLTQRIFQRRTPDIIQKRFIIHVLWIFFDYNLIIKLTEVRSLNDFVYYVHVYIVFSLLINKYNWKKIKFHD